MNLEISNKVNLLLSKFEIFFKIFLISIINFLKKYLAGFVKFLFDRNIVQTGIGIIIASQISKLTGLFIDTLINPIITRITAGNVKTMEEWSINIFDIKIKIGLIISSLVNFVLLVFIIYQIWQLSQITDFKVINNLLDNTKENITKTRVIINVPAQSV